MSSGQAGWKQALLQSLEANKEAKHSTFFQLATVNADGRPSNRTMVHRGFAGDSDNKLTFTTDSRSQKYDEVKSNPWAEACWYFTESREQYRLGGKLIIVDKDEKDPQLHQLWLDSWRNISPGGRSWFTWPSQKEPRTPDDDEFNKPAPEPESDPLPNYCLGILDVDRVDHLLLKEKHRHEWHSEEVDGDRRWTSEDKNP
jgi:PPOX class probable FMN-dependent enzyme